MHKNGYSTRGRKISSSGRGKRRGRRGKREKKRKQSPKNRKAPKNRIKTSRQKTKKIEEQEKESLARWRGLARVGEGDFHYQLVTTSELRRKG
jgi:hypothetical protein